ASTTFTITPSISHSPISGSSGTVVTVSGVGYAPDSAIVISFDGSPVETTPASIITDATGSFSATFTAFAQLNGIYEIQATGDNGAEAFDYFYMTDAVIIAEPQAAKVGQIITVTGTDFEPDSEITLTFDGDPVETTPARVTTD